MMPPLYRILVLFLLMSFKAYAQDPINAPVYQQGDCWTFSAVNKNYLGYTSNALEDGEHEICYEAGRFYKVGKGDKYGVTGVWVGLLHMGGVDTRKFLDNFPLFVGKKWSLDYVTEVRGTNRRERRHAETQVVGIEHVQTKLGAMQAFKIERSQWWYGSLTGKYTYYWSPQTKSVVKYNYEAILGSNATRQIELIKYDVITEP